MEQFFNARVSKKKPKRRGGNTETKGDDRAFLGGNAS
jgi:hypothetical protein